MAKMKGVGSVNLPTLQDFKKSVPKGGLLNKGLRQGYGKGIGRIKPLDKPKGNFKNVGM